MALEYLKRAEQRPEEDLSSVRTLVSEILDRVKKEGEKAVRYYSERFDKWNPASFRVTKEEIADAEKKVPEGLKKDIHFLHEQVENFAKEQKKTLIDFEKETTPGVFLGQKYLPIQSLGVYVPGGRYALIASSQMSIVPAKVAGVERIVACVPGKNAVLNPAVVYAIHVAGADEIFSMGGAQAIAAMTFGLGEALKPVDMIAGPGNKFVLEAKRQVFGRVGIDLLAGPTEIGIIADDTADPFLVCCDLVGQAEHDPQSRAVLITSSLDLGTAVVKGIEEHLQSISTQEVARSCWVHGGEVILVENEDELIRVADEYALEHVEVHVRDPLRLIERLRDYGALFVGEETTVAYGDKVSGTNHILPTHRAARFTGGLWVGKFLKTVTFQYMGANESLEMARHCEVEATAEGMVAHARTARVRLERYVSHDVAPR